MEERDTGEGGWSWGRHQNPHAQWTYCSICCLDSIAHSLATEVEIIGKQHYHTTVTCTGGREEQRAVDKRRE